MKIPKKITPDYLKDTIIQILYDPVCHPELVLGRFEVFVSKDFNFKGGRPSRNEMRLPDGAAMTIEQLQSGFFIHKTLPIKLNINPGNIVFNTFDQYIGWKKYATVIYSILEKAIKYKIIERISRVSIRYISQIKNIRIFENARMSFSIDILNGHYDSTQIRTEFELNDKKVILTVLNGLANQMDDKEGILSIVDIDVIKFIKDNDINIKMLKEIINDVHYVQKEVFFKFLKQEFIKSLKPEY